MATRLVALFGAVAALVLAGCITPPSTDVDTQSALTGLLAPETPLWNDPQNAPHPLYNYPTLTNVPASPDLPAFWEPIPARALPASITGIEPVAETQTEVGRGAGIAMFGSLVIVPGYGETSKVMDVSDPAAPQVLGEMEAEGGNHRGAIVIAYPDGRLVTAFSTAYGFDVWDITTPTEPVHLTQVEAPNGGHKIGVVPGTPIVYNAHSGGGSNVEQLAEATTEIYDLTNPAEPTLVQEFQNGFGCHHIYFWISAAEDKFRALCAGIEYTQIWDIADPLNPEVLVNIPVHHGVVGTPSYSTYLNFAHFAVLSQDGKTLIVGDETGGGGLPPGCDVRVDTPVKQVSGPFGNVWFYDVTDETNPQLKGWFSPTTLLPDRTSCTAHHGRLVPDPENRDLLAMAFYGAGVVLIDFSDTSDPRLVDQWADGTNTWEVAYYNGYLFTGDLNRGMDVLTFA